MLYRASKSFDNLCSNFIIYIISEKNWGHKGRVTFGNFPPLTGFVSIPARSHTFVEIDHEIVSTVILLLPLIHSRRVVVSYKRKYVHELLVIRLFKPAQEKVWLGELTVPQ